MQLGGGGLAYAIPPRGAVISNADGSYEPANANVVEVRYHYQAKETRCALQPTCNRPCTDRVPTVYRPVTDI